VIVLLINQYLLQAYQIPSPSMVPSLLTGDRIFVNKIVYGPELVPGMLKIPGFRSPSRGEVIIFESPEYLSSGPLMEILQRVVYMVTLSLVDIDRDEFGNPKHHFLIKRAIGMPGDRIRMNDGNVEVLTPGASQWVPESELKADLGLRYPNTRTYKEDQYPTFRDVGIALALSGNGLIPTPSQLSALKQYYDVTTDSTGLVTVRSQREIGDDIDVTMWGLQTAWQIDPTAFSKATLWRMYHEGYPVPLGRIFPMGDNRDDSRDARYFGPVRLEKVLGKGLFRYWPISRFGGIR
jgi:signal peptidase I